MTTYYKLTDSGYDFTARKFDSKSAAKRAGNDGYIFSTIEELMSHPISTGKMVLAHNQLAGTDIKRFSDRSAGARRLFMVIAEKEDQIMEDTPAVHAAPKAAKAPKAVVAVATENPYNKGSKSHEAFELIKNNPGLIIAALVAKGADKKGVYRALNEKHAAFA